MKAKILMSALLVIFSLAARAGIVYVDSSNVSGPQDGLSWATAFSGVQNGVNAAASGDSVWVAKGTYQPALNTSFSMKQGVKIFGGFLNTHTLFSQRNWITNPTVLKGNGTGVIYNYSNGVDNNSWLDGFTVTKGKVVGGSGGGIYNYYTAPSIRNCTFIADTATGVGTQGGGGAIYNYFNLNGTSGQGPVIQGCYFKHNVVNTGYLPQGGAIMNYGSSATIANCTFDSNAVISSQASGSSSGYNLYGGAICNYGGSTTINNCTFTKNYGKALTPYSHVVNVEGGAVSIPYGGYHLIQNCVFNGNIAWGTSSGSSIDYGSGSGGAIYTNGYSSTNQSQTTVKGCSFINNTAAQNTTFGNGGAVFNGYYSTLKLDSCSFTANKAGNGSGVYGWDSTLVSRCTFFQNKKAKNGTSIYMSSLFDPFIQITSCSFLKDSATARGGAIYSESPGMRILNSVFSQCKADSFGGAIYNTAGQARIINSTISRNHAVYGAAVYNANNGVVRSINSIIWGNTGGIQGDGTGSANAFYSLVQGYPASTPNQNLAGTTNPLFVDTAINNFRLQSGSPCINAGRNDSLPTFITTDLAGNARINLDTVDMGAYEWLLTPPQVALGNDTLICPGATVTLHAGNTASTYLWSTGATSESITVSASGSYTVVVTNGAGSDTDTILVTVVPLPVVNLGADTGFCPGSMVALNAQNSGAAYLWSTGATTQTISAGTAGTYVVQVTNSNGCVGKDTIQIAAFAAPVLSLGAGQTICAGSTATIGTTAVTGSNYLWSTGATTPTITVSATGNYTLNVTDSNSCTAAATKTVTVQALPVVNLGADVNMCTINTAILNAGNPGAAYAWSTGATTQTITVATSGTYFVAVTGPAQCVGTDTIVVTVHPTPVVNLGTDVTLPAGTSAYTLDAGNPGLAYAWSTGATTQTISVSSSGTYSVSVTSSFGCTAKDTIQVTFQTGSGVAQAPGISGWNISVAPDPVGSHFAIITDGPLPRLLSLVVSDASGRVVLRKTVEHSGQLIDVAGLAPGLYVARVSDTDGQSRAIRFVKE